MILTTKRLNRAIKAEVDRRVKEELKEAYKHLGFSDPNAYDFLFGGWPATANRAGIYPPRFSVSERVDAIAAHLGLVFDKTDAKPAKVILRKPHQKDRPVVYRKKGLYFKEEEAK